MTTGTSPWTFPTITDEELAQLARFRSAGVLA